MNGEQQHFERLLESISRGSTDDIKVLLASLRPSEVAALVEANTPDTRRIIWGLLEEEVRNQSLQHLHDNVRVEFLQAMDTAQLVTAAEKLDTNDFDDIPHQLPNTITDQVLEKLDSRDRARVESVLAYADDSAGGLMNTDTITVRPRHAAQLVLRYLRLRRELPATTDALIVVNSKDKYLGMLPLNKLLTADPTVTVREIMNGDEPSVHVDTPDTEVARLFSERDLISAPVINDDGCLVGRITIDDVVEVIIEDAEEALLAPAGLAVDTDIFAPVRRAVRRRAVWLGINLLTALLAAAVISMFEETIIKVVALAVLMPAIASMSGIADTQTLTLVIRGQATGQLGRSNMLRMLNREFIIAGLNGVLWAALVALGATYFFADAQLGLVIAVAMVTTILIAATAGSLLPILLRRMNIDPAIAGGIVLTTITDVAGFFIFLGLASWVYL